MKTSLSRIGVALAILAAGGLLAPVSARAQLSGVDQMYAADSQRNALQALRYQVTAFQNVLQTAPSYPPEAGYDIVQGHFASLREAYSAFKATLGAAPLANGTDNFAEIDQGLAILGEGLGNYRTDVAMGDSDDVAVRDLCRDLADGAKAWWQQLLTDCSRAQIPVY